MCNVFWIGQVWSIGGFSCPLWIRSCRTMDGVNSSLWETGYLSRLRSSYLSRSVQNPVQMNAILDYKPTHMCVETVGEWQHCSWDFNSFQWFKAVRLVNIVTGFFVTTVGGDKLLLCYEWVIESFTQPKLTQHQVVHNSYYVILKFVSRDLLSRYKNPKWQHNCHFRLFVCRLLDIVLLVS